MIGDIIYNDLNDTGRLKADGSLISEVGYPELYAILQQYHNPGGAIPAGFYPLPIIPSETHNNITIPTQIQAEAEAE